MTISTSISRLTAYHARNGFRATVRRTGVAAKRALFANRMVLFYCDLSKPDLSSMPLPSFLKVERKKIAAELSAEDLKTMTNFWNPKLARRNIAERFEKGASLWLIRCDGNLAGYGWTLRGSTIEPHYFPLAQDDVHFFDFHVFPQYRGRGMNPFLVNQILRELVAEGPGRAFIEAAEWNQAQLSSLTRTPFRPLGFASKLTVFGRTLVLLTADTAFRSGGSYITQDRATQKHAHV